MMSAQNNRWYLCGAIGGLTDWRSAHRRQYPMRAVMVRRSITRSLASTRCGRRYVRYTTSTADRMVFEAGLGSSKKLKVKHFW